MSVNLIVINATDGEKISVEIDETDSVGDIVVFASQYWNKDKSAFVMKMNNRLLQPNLSAEELGLKSGDTVVLVPDPQGG